jgi:hypothetical protein
MTIRDRPVEYVAARRVLLDALTALQGPHRPFILVGAQAVYVRTGELALDSSVAPYTTDADLVIDPALLGGDPQIDQAMKGAGFSLSQDPGTWEMEVDLGGRSMVVPVDLLVPDTLAGPGRRAARLADQRKRVARRTPGLEVALVDNDLVPIASLDETDDRELVVPVAGAAALFAAKARKVVERIDDGKPSRIKAKDASDIYRLMISQPAEDVGRRMGELRSHATAGSAVQKGVQDLVLLFGRPQSPGVRLAIEALEAGTVPAPAIQAVTVGYVEEMRAAYEKCPRANG